MKKISLLFIAISFITIQKSFSQVFIGLTASKVASEIFLEEKQNAGKISSVEMESFFDSLNIKYNSAKPVKMHLKFSATKNYCNYQRIEFGTAEHLQGWVKMILNDAGYKWEEMEPGLYISSFKYGIEMKVGNKDVEFFEFIGSSDEYKKLYKANKSKAVIKK